MATGTVLDIISKFSNMEGDLKSMLTEKRSCEVHKRLHGKVQDKLGDAIMKIRCRHHDVNSGINDRDL